MPNKLTPPDWVRRAADNGKVERIEAFFSGHGYSPHRHDTYALGMTLSGVQRFQYRRAQCNSLAGTAVVLHPDELHDGEAGTDAGFHYRMAYIEPALIQQILGGKPLPFIEGGLSNDVRLQTALLPLLRDTSFGLDALEEDDALYDLAHALTLVSGGREVRRSPDVLAVERARARIHDTLTEPVSLDALAQAGGLDRWRLCRDFRALYGTSPYRYQTMRRLDLVRRLMWAGQDISQAALAAGFFDQSHMTRLFVRAYGVTPARWLQRFRQ